MDNSRKITVNGQSMLRRSITLEGDIDRLLYFDGINDVSKERRTIEPSFWRVIDNTYLEEYEKKERVDIND